MQPEIMLCVSQQINETPYQFKVTGVHVYSFEEALYHVYHYWKQSVDDFLSDEMIAWVNDALGLSFLAARMKELARNDSFSRRLIAFLQLIDYFDADALDALSGALADWEKRKEWEKLKERADFLLRRGEPDKALLLYRRALQYEENAALYNNLGIAQMQLASYGDAYESMCRAHALEPNNPALTLRLAEAAIYDCRYNEARTWLSQGERQTPGHRDIPLLYGMLYFGQGDYAQAAAYYEKAIAIAPEPFFLYRMADVYAAMRQYDRALAILAGVREKDVSFSIKQAELHAAAGNVPAAIKSVQAAIAQNDKEAGLWVKLAQYYRMDYDFNAANEAVKKALEVDPESERAKLESARVKKGLGRTRDYQAVMNSVLRGFKRKYREYY